MGLRKTYFFFNSISKNKKITSSTVQSGSNCFLPIFISNQSKIWTKPKLWTVRGVTDRTGRSDLIFKTMLKTGEMQHSQKSCELFWSTSDNQMQLHNLLILVAFPMAMCYSKTMQQGNLFDLTLPKLYEMLFSKLEQLLLQQTVVANS